MKHKFEGRGFNFQSGNGMHYFVDSIEVNGDEEESELTAILTYDDVEFKLRIPADQNVLSIGSSFSLVKSIHDNCRINHESAVYIVTKLHQRFNAHFHPPKETIIGDKK